MYYSPTRQNPLYDTRTASMYGPAGRVGGCCTATYGFIDRQPSDREEYAVEDDSRASFVLVPVIQQSTQGTDDINRQVANYARTVAAAQQVIRQSSSSSSSTRRRRRRPPLPRPSSLGRQMAGRPTDRKRAADNPFRDRYVILRLIKAYGRAPPIEF